MRLPQPTDDTLAGCFWLARLHAKAAAHRRDELPGDYVMAFGHPLGMDGHFLRFFGLIIDDVLAAADRDTEAFAAWFLTQPAVSPERVAAWNAACVDYGRPGHPMHDRLLLGLEGKYAHLAARAPQTVFKTLVMDEEDTRPNGHSAENTPSRAI